MLQNTMYENYAPFLIHRVLSRAIPNGDCLEYRAGNLKHKYGLVSVTVDGKRKSIPAHRALWMATHNCFDLPSNIHICHKCDNPSCVNIAHLFAGTPKDNMQDCISKDRKAKTRKLHTRQRVLDDATVQAIRNATGKLKYIADEYGITVGYASKLRNGKAKTLIP